MNRKYLLSLLLGFGSTVALAQQQEVYFATNPSISPDAKNIVFSYEGDLWQVSSNGGNAMRLTGMAGNETRPRISPDGKWIAFTSSQYGNQDVFVMPIGGGEIKQLTFHESSDEVDSWSWDSKTIYFTSDRYNRYSAYKIDLSGGTPQRMFQHYFHTVHNVAEHPSSGEIFFDESWESKNFTHRKGYKGAYNPDVQSYNNKTKEYKRYTDYDGKDLWVSIDKQGSLYFASDEANGEYNLYTFKDGKKTQLTSFETSIKTPSVSANGEKVVFEKDYQVYVYDKATGKSNKVQITALQNSTLEKEKDYTVAGNITNFDVSPDNKKMAFVSRGKLFVSDVKGKFVREIPTRASERVGEVMWMADNKRLVYTQTNNGYFNLFVIAADGSSKEVQLTNELQNNRNVVFSKDKSQGVYYSGSKHLKHIDLKTLKTKTLVEDEIWALYNSDPSFSPDGQYVLFTAYRNFEEDIFIHQLANSKTFNLTNSGVTETAPYWSPDGNYIYFASDRTNPSYPYGMKDPDLYRIALNKLEKPYRSDKYNELFKEAPVAAAEAKDDKSKKGKKTEKEVKPAPAKQLITLDLTDLQNRWERVAEGFGFQGNPKVLQKDDKTTVLFTSNHGDGKANIWKHTTSPFEEPKTEKVAGADAGSISLVTADNTHYLLLKGNVHTFNLDGNKVEKIEVNHTFRKNLKDEFNQMFYEMWAGVEENFYDDAFHGIDWTKKKETYAKLLPYVSNRADLRTLLNDMLGELNSSHMGFTSNGTEEQPYYKTRSLATGLLFEDDKPYQVKAVVQKSALDVKGKDVQPGDVLVKVDGQPVDQKQNREFYFMKPSLQEETELTFARSGKEFTVKVHPQSYGSQRENLYDEWVATNQKYVDDASGNKIAYVHMKNMSTQALEQFLIEMTTEGYQRNGLILDLRYNTGGNVHNDVLRFLAQKPYLQWKYRGGALTNQPNFTPAAGQMVLLMNEQTLSDGEMTATGFKELGLGKIIGTDTYRWIIFTSGKGLVDGSFYRLPAWGCYTLDGKNIEREGVQPDIYLKTTFKDRLENKDPQLERAIQEIMNAPQTKR
ncbi:S41 family peptidase [Pontibacter cellulosilyticus]|uniref:Tricorn protease homolog n=1 Tax=Pontibacter cellulosilyticus TaxID=1720253 RepID=A0A923NBD3_9BACT|nr:S41 family peptidase [Pontibacter cellulosilyticus]MBC5994307.1 PD40 domain-containing protein [Pontibacter cellulosilyticus]